MPHPNTATQHAHVGLGSLACAVLLLASCMLFSPPARAIGGQFGFEFAIDAPWRLEPARSADGSLAYGPIPVTIAFHDAVFEVSRGRLLGLALPRVDIGQLREVRVREWTQDQPIPRHPVTVVPASGLYEIERKERVSTRTTEPRRDLCRPNPGENCSTLLKISDTHEWHGTFWYTPRAAVVPGRNIHLDVTVVTEVRLLGVPIRTKEWRNLLVVHAGEAPLPRFSDQWLYGDLHYHSQMSDNEGESAYTLRNVARALGALGMDFVFATDHASNGNQVDGRIDARYCADSRGDSCLEARDLNVHRYAAARNILYGPDSANEAIQRDAVPGRFARHRSAGILPQVYMGEELDAWPEISAREQASGLLNYGDGLTYAWPDANKCLAAHSLTACRAKYSRMYAPRDHRSFLVLDEQGLPIQETIGGEIGGSGLGDLLTEWAPDGTSPLPSRQHFVYFPFTAGANTQGWIGSNTGYFGGASKRLENLLREVEPHGVGFLAHPLTGNRPGSAIGPDVVPYSQRALDRAWQSPATLGMEFWNENDRRQSRPDTRSPTVMSVSSEGTTERFTFLWPYQGHEYGNFPWRWQRGVGTHVAAELYHDAFTWDRMLRKGLDLQQTATLRWLPRGQPRKWLMAGGSDAHGDFNYRRYGRPCKERWCDVPIGDTAIGNPRNLVSMLPRLADGPPLVLGDVDGRDPRRPVDPRNRRHDNLQVLDALGFGNFSVSDGPAIRIAVDRNRNGVIDDADFQMGTTVNFYAAEHVPVLVEWMSTREFGPVTQVDVYVGNALRTFAPSRHGPLIPGGQNRNPEFGNYQPDPSGALQARLTDGFGRYNLPDIPAERGYHGVMKLFLGPAQFGMVSGDGALSYVRAFARTVSAQQGDDMDYCVAIGTAGSMCGDRFAYANPVWLRYRATCPTRPRFPMVTAPPWGKMYVDADGDAYPDGCATRVADPCPRVREEPPVLADADAAGGVRVPAHSCRSVAAATL